MGDDKANQRIPQLGPDTIRVHLFLSGNRVLAHTGVGFSGRSAVMDYFELCADHALRFQASDEVDAVSAPVYEESTTDDNCTFLSYAGRFLKKILTKFGCRNMLNLYLFSEKDLVLLNE